MVRQLLLLLVSGENEMQDFSKGQNGSHFEPRPVPPPLPKKCDWEIDSTELDFSGAVIIGKLLTEYLNRGWWLNLSTMALTPSFKLLAPPSRLLTCPANAGGLRAILTDQNKLVVAVGGITTLAAGVYTTSLQEQSRTNTTTNLNMMKSEVNGTNLSTPM